MNVHNTKQMLQAHDVDFKEVIMSITNENEAANFKYHRLTFQRLKIVPIAHINCYKTALIYNQL